MRTVALAIALFALAGCPKAPEKPAAAAPAPSDKPAGQTDADKRKLEALDHAVQVDGALPTYARAERVTEVPPRKIELWRDGKLPAKLRVNDVAPDGKVAHVTDFYFTNGRLTYVRHEDGLFMFDGASLVLFLDPKTQQMKKGVKPDQALKIGDDLQKTAQTEVALFKS